MQHPTAIRTSFGTGGRTVRVAGRMALALPPPAADSAPPEPNRRFRKVRSSVVIAFGITLLLSALRVATTDPLPAAVDFEIRRPARHRSAEVATPERPAPTAIRTQDLESRAPSP